MAKYLRIFNFDELFVTKGFDDSITTSKFYPKLKLIKSGKPSGSLVGILLSEFDALKKAFPLKNEELIKKLMEKYLSGGDDVVIASFSPYKLAISLYLEELFGEQFKGRNVSFLSVEEKPSEEYELRKQQCIDCIKKWKGFTEEEVDFIDDEVDLLTRGITLSNASASVASAAPARGPFRGAVSASYPLEGAAAAAAAAAGVDPDPLAVLVARATAAPAPLLVSAAAASASVASAAPVPLPVSAATASALALSAAPAPLPASVEVAVSAASHYPEGAAVGVDPDPVEALVACATVAPAPLPASAAAASALAPSAAPAPLPASGRYYYCDVLYFRRVVRSYNRSQLLEELRSCHQVILIETPNDMDEVTIIGKSPEAVKESKEHIRRIVLPYMGIFGRFFDPYIIRNSGWIRDNEGVGLALEYCISAMGWIQEKRFVSDALVNRLVDSTELRGRLRKAESILKDVNLKFKFPPPKVMIKDLPSTQESEPFAPSRISRYGLVSLSWIAFDRIDVRVKYSGDRPSPREEVSGSIITIYPLDFFKTVGDRIISIECSGWELAKNPSGIMELVAESVNYLGLYSCSLGLSHDDYIRRCLYRALALAGEQKQESTLVIFNPLRVIEAGLYDQFSQIRMLPLWAKEHLSSASASAPTPTPTSTSALANDTVSFKLKEEVLIPSLSNLFSILSKDSTSASTSTSTSASAPAPASAALDSIFVWKKIEEAMKEEADARSAASGSHAASVSAPRVHASGSHADSVLARAAPGSYAASAAAPGSDADSVLARLVRAAASGPASMGR